MPSPSFPENTTQLIKDQANIVDIIGEFVSLRRSGINYKGLCPFHAEKTPSFMVNPERRTFHCFGCGEGGDIFAFLMQYHGLSFFEAVKELAGRYHIPLPEKKLSSRERKRAESREILLAINEAATAAYHDQLLKDPQAENARRYLKKRGMDSEIITSFRLGFAPDRWDFLFKTLSKRFSAEDIKNAGLAVAKERGGYYDRFRNRILFPIYNLSGKVTAFGGRILGEGQPKYLNSPETLIFDKGRTLFGLYQQRDIVRKTRQCVVVEGNFDLLALIAHGIKNVAAPLGTALTQSHIRTLKGYADEVILLFDGDSAGVQAAIRSVPLFMKEQVMARVALLPKNHDPDTFVREFGKEGLEKCLSEACSVSEFVFSRLVEKYGLSLEGKAKIMAELRPVIDSIDERDPERMIFVSHFSQKLGLTPEQLLTGPVSRAGVSRANAATEKQPRRKMSLPLKQRQLIEFLIIYPEYLPKFMEAGIEVVINDPSGMMILNQLNTFISQGLQAGPERLLEVLPPGPEKTFVSGLLTSTPSFTEEMKDVMSDEMVSWLKKTVYRIKTEELTRLIGEAQQSNNETLLMELIKQKKKIDA